MQKMATSNLSKKFWRNLFLTRCSRFLLKINKLQQISLVLNLETPALKLVSAIFYQFFVFPQNASPSKTMKSVFYFNKKALFVLEIFILL